MKRLISYLFKVVQGQKQTISFWKDSMINIGLLLCGVATIGAMLVFGAGFFGFVIVGCQVNPPFGQFLSCVLLAVVGLVLAICFGGTFSVLLQKAE